ncbi:hypothetical protein BS50DRAFT_401536 [Corynespora cassiicola Philippines]|uniref:Uncharacterized protein n=1 Tax=Corynespora cassiicola Philippines TaxID=1448308 RepID=A0A2T2NKL0_CORCC|nr:hypothetical protein BS50DRAFT_401536 [Corynespora cassiicola Philippines]
MGQVWPFWTDLPLLFPRGRGIYLGGEETHKVCRVWVPLPRGVCGFWRSCPGGWRRTDWCGLHWFNNCKTQIGRWIATLDSTWSYDVWSASASALVHTYVDATAQGPELRSNLARLTGQWVPRQRAILRQTCLDWKVHVPERWERLGCGGHACHGCRRRRIRVIRDYWHGIALQCVQGPRYTDKATRRWHVMEEDSGIGIALFGGARGPGRKEVSEHEHENSRHGTSTARDSAVPYLLRCTTGRLCRVGNVSSVARRRMW